MTTTAIQMGPKTPTGGAYDLHSCADDTKVLHGGAEDHYSTVNESEDSQGGVTMQSPVCLIDNDVDGKLCVKESALQILQKIEQPVVVVAVVGLYRTGKSYLMNRLAGKQTGFELGSTVESKTKGIWMWCLPHPTKEGTTLVLLDTEGLGDVDKVTDRFCKYIFDKSEMKKLKDGYTVTGRVFGQLVKTYVDTISSGQVPFLENAVLTVSVIENESAVKEGLQVYQSGMEKLKDSFPLELSDVCAEHQRLSRMEEMNKLFDGYLHQNEEASKKRCENLLTTLSAPMTEKLKKGFYAVAGGYVLFSQDLEDIVKKYKTQANKGVKAEDTLEEFLKQKSVDSNAILQADKKLTEKEKKIMGERLFQNRTC
ncbi:hypothetical protein cypCar_00016986 [Cyprinus carpio]|nr:hypothetical protein cypCar_00016986 [Cyprinus carpio]